MLVLTVYLFVYKSSSFLDVKLFCMRASYYWPHFVVETYSTKKLGALLLLLFVYKSGLLVFKFGNAKTIQNCLIIMLLKRQVQSTKVKISV